MNLLRIATALSVALACGQAYGAEDSVKLKSLRDTPIEATSRADSFRNLRDREPFARDFVHQPPLIPHAVRGYNVTVNFNKCMDCHSWSKAKEAGATKVSLTHFKDRDGRDLSNISPRRYFCLQCHVPQTDAQPLVSNTFKPVDALQR
ncbi:MAG: nitrate reductase cytochrome c-type subunit [Burkholderiales bacterium]|nr:nitrate reductase cytochrome c-type subunit [Burkholderiales bacterium]